jgi:uracil phosphoribosyltransferase
LSLHILTEQNSIVNNFIAELRDKRLQKDGMRFRWNMERTGEIMAYEISKHFEYEQKSIETQLGTSNMALVKDAPYIITILRAGIPFYKGFINIFDQSESGFIGAFRSDQDENNQFEIEMGYTAIGDVNNKKVILVDPMVATGKSILKAANYIMKYGQPAKMYVAALIGAREGYEYLKNNLKMPVEYWFGDLDDELNDKSYIVPGLGDAGDLCFGEKL